MARDSEKRPEVAELIRRIELSRHRLGDQAQQLKRSLDIPAKVRSSVSRSPFAWFGGSLGAGLLFSRVMRRRPKKTEAPKKTTLGVLLTIIVALLKPAFKGLVMNELQRRIVILTGPKNKSRETHL